ncbi:hypothetical protein LJR118_004464 [Acidovorax sp. LjRoot118]|uniref:hypothetical protein n=1 Tax=Acidovorax sp. LjRoot118 TaxID=3342256 RepID=UPI000A775BE3
MNAARWPDLHAPGLASLVRGGVVVQFAPAVADLAGLASAVTTALPGATLKPGAEGVLQLGFGGTTYVLKPDWTGAGVGTGAGAGTHRIGVDEQGRIVFQAGSGPKQLLLPALLSTAQAQGIFSAAMPGSTLAVQPGSSDGAFTLTLGGQAWRLVPQLALPTGAAGQREPWRMGADGVLYLKLGTQVQVAASGGLTCLRKRSATCSDLASPSPCATGAACR